MTIKYQSVDQVLNAVNLSGVSGSQSDVIRTEFRAALKPVVGALFESSIPDEERDSIMSSLLDVTTPNLVRTFTKHWVSKAA
jgi:hypothetical protein